MKKTRVEAEQTREMLLKSGYDLFVRRGFEAATLEQVARECGLTRGSAYYHFSNKTDLYKTIVRNTLAEIHESKMEILHNEDLDLAGKLIGLLCLPIHNKSDYRLVNRSVELARSHSDFSDLDMEIGKAKKDLYILLFDLLTENGFQDAAPLANVIYYIFEGFYFCSEQRDITEEEINQIVYMLISCRHSG